MTIGIIEDLETAIALHSALEGGNDAIRDIHSGQPAVNFYGAHCYNYIKSGLTIGLALTLAKLFDPHKLFDYRAGGSRRSPNESDIISIPLLVRLLKQRRCRALLGRKARDRTPTLEDMEAVNETSALEAVDAAVNAYAAFRQTQQGRTAARVLKKFRNHQLAHGS